MNAPHTKPRYGAYFTALVILIAAASQFASDMYLPSLPAIAQAFHSTNTTLGLTITIFLLGQAIFQWVYGPPSERYGRKRLILSGMVLAGVGSLVCLWSSHISTFFIGRFLQGAGSAALLCLALAAIRDAFSEEKLGRALSLVNMTFSIVFAVAPIIGGYLQNIWGWQANFIVVAVYLLALFILASFTLPETHSHDKRDINGTKLSVILKNSGELLTSRVFMGYTMMVGICYAILVAYATLTPFLFQQVIGLTPVVYGWLSIVNAAALIISSATVAAIFGKLGIQKIIKLGLTIMLLGAVCMLITGLMHWVNIVVIMVSMFITLYGATFIFNAGGAGAMTPFGHIAGTAGAMYVSLQMFAAFVAGSIASYFHASTQLPLAIILVIIGVLSLLLNIFVIPKQA